MTLDEESSSWKRREKKRRQYQLKNLPYHLDGSIVDDELSPDEQKTGAARALKRIQQGVQGNFDHISTEMTRFAKLYNEGEADSAYMRDLLDPHDHEPGLAQNPSRSEDVGFDQWYMTYHWNAPSEDAIVSHFLEAEPIRFDDNVYGDKLDILVEALNGSTRSYQAAVYNGDNPGGLPGSLLYDAGSKVTAAGHMTWDIDVHFKKGLWYWLVVSQKNNAGAGTPNVQGWDSSGSGGNGVDSYSAHWWPFPHQDQDDQGGITGVGIDALAYASGDPFPQQVYVADFYDAVESPILRVRVP